VIDACCCSVCCAIVLVVSTDSLLGDGCRVMEGSVVKNTVVGSCAYIDQHCYIQVRHMAWGGEGGRG